MMILLYFILSFFIGAIPFADIISKKKGINIKEVGSRNPGATNVARNLGWKPGLLVLILDALKGVFAIHIYKYFPDIKPSNLTDIEFMHMVGLFAILGHMISPFLNWKGGKGVSTTLGVYLYLYPVSAFIAIGTFGVVFFFQRVMSIATLVGLISIPIAYFMLNRLNYSNISLILFFFNIALILYAHKSNIIRIINRTEYKFFHRK